MIEYVSTLLGETVYLQKETHKNVQNNPNVYSLLFDENINSDLGEIKLNKNNFSYFLTTPSGEYSGNFTISQYTEDIFLISGDVHFICFLKKDYYENNNSIALTWTGHSANSFIFNNYFYFSFLNLGNLGQQILKSGYELKRFSTPEYKKNYIFSLGGTWLGPGEQEINPGFYIIRKNLGVLPVGLSLVHFFPFENMYFGLSALAQIEMVGNGFYTYIKVKDIEQEFVSLNNIESVYVPPVIYEENGALLEVAATKNRIPMKHDYIIEKIQISSSGDDMGLPPPPSIISSTLPGGYVQVEINQILTQYIHRQECIIGDEIFNSVPRPNLTFISNKKYNLGSEVQIEYNTYRKNGQRDIHETRQHLVSWSLVPPENLDLY